MEVMKAGRINWLFSYCRIVRHCESIVGHFESIVGQCEIQA